MKLIYQISLILSFIVSTGSSKSYAFSIAETAYSLINGDCDQGTAALRVSSVKKLCAFTATSVDSFSKELEEKIYLSSLAKLRAENLKCVQQQVDFVTRNSKTTDEFIEEYTHKVILLTNEKRQMDALLPYITTDKKAKEEYTQARLRAEAISAALPLIETHAFSGTVNALISQAPASGELPEWYFKTLKDNLKAALPLAKKEIAKNRLAMEDGAGSKGAKLNSSQIESLAQDTQLIESFRKKKVLTEEELKSVACRVDAKYGQGAKYVDNGLVTLSILGLPVATGLTGLGQAALRSSLIGAAATGRIATTAASILKPLTFLSFAASTIGTIESRCLTEAPTLKANQCQAEAMVGNRKQDCVLIGALTALGAKPVLSSAKKSLRSLQNAALTVDREFAQTEVIAMPKMFAGEEKGQSIRFQNWKVKYFTAEEQNSMKAVVKDGKLYDAGGNPLNTGPAVKTHTSDDYAIFVVNEKGEIIVSKEATDGYIHHSSLVAGGPVRMAGEIEVVDGVIKTITPKSGHYMPSDWHLDKFVEALKTNGVDTSKIKVVHWGSP